MKTGETEKNIRGILIFFSVLIASAFGPYVVAGAGIRTEHALIYPCVAIFLMSSRWSIVWPKSITVLFTVLAIEMGWLAVVTFIIGLGSNIDAPPTLKVVSHFENVVQPLAVIVLVMLIYQKHPRQINRALLNKVALTIILLLVCNTIVAGASIFVDLAGVMDPFYASSAFSPDSAWQDHMVMDRYTGIYNMPFVSGVSYSLGILLWAYRVRIAGSIGSIDLMLLIGLALGGLLSVSKVFIIGGVLVFLVYLRPLNIITNSFRSAALSIIAISVTLLVGVPWLGSLEDIETFDRVMQYLTAWQNSDDLLAVYTANRLVPGESIIIPLFVEAWQEAPVAGFGLAASTMLDNGYLEAFYQGGLIALLAYLTGLAIIVGRGWQLWSARIEEGRLLIAIGVLVIGANIGATATSANRFSVLLWVTITLLFLTGERAFRNQVVHRGATHFQNVN